jgi:hypothetical protein
VSQRTKQLDIAQRIAEAIRCTSDSRQTATGQMRDDGEVIGSVPTHLQHLHNLLSDLAEEAAEAAAVLASKRERLLAVWAILFDALKDQMPEIQKTSSMLILENWNVVAVPEPEDLRNDGGKDFMEIMKKAMRG